MLLFMLGMARVNPRCCPFFARTGYFILFLWFQLPSMQAAERRERKLLKSKRQMGEDGIPEDDLQVVSGEQQLENLDPKQRAKMEHKRGLIRAGMGATADEPEKHGFEIAKASIAAQAMLGERKKPFEVDGLPIADDREYGSEQVSGMDYEAICRNMGVLLWGASGKSQTYGMLRFHSCR